MTGVTKEIAAAKEAAGKDYEPIKTPQDDGDRSNEMVGGDRKAAIDKALEGGSPVYENLPVHGYKPEPLSTIVAVNYNKELEETILRVLDSLKLNPYIDMRWLAIGRTHIEQGFMAINRAIFKPERVTLNDDRGNLAG